MYTRRIIAVVAVIVVAIVAIVGVLFLFPTEGPIDSYCGDGICDEVGETWISCPDDCDEPDPEYCGNGICEPEYGENCFTCSQDCGECPLDSVGLGFRLPYDQVSTGDEFFVVVYLDPEGEEVSFWKISTSFDSSRLEVLGVSEGNSIWLFDEGTTDTGTITDIQAWTMDDYPTYKTDLCVIKFKALSTGSAVLDFTGQKIGGSDPETIITVTENSNTIVIG